MKRGRIIFLSIILLIFIISMFLTFFYHPKCKDIACWNYKLENCNKAKYLNDAIDITWEYTILGKEGGKCVINVKALNIKRGLQKTIELENKEMKCYLPLGVIIPPETDPNLCTGRLKEEMQTLIIEKLHQYILSNIGKISDDLKTI